MVELSMALTGARALLDTARAAIEARDNAKVQAALSDLQTKLHDATSAALASAERAMDLQTALVAAQRANADLEAKLADRTLYRLHELRPGAFVYAAQRSGEGVDPPQHYICQNCYDKGVKSVLRLQPGGSYFSDQWVCAEAKEHTIVV
ncbi:MAG: hypothetical protein RIS35_2896 [Pseudomonadota bacterium]|jgi:hypothetical protein